MTINILIFEDAVIKMESFKEYLTLRLKHELKCDLELTVRSDNAMLETDLMTKDFHVILIDDDLGNNRFGNEIIDEIIIFTDNTPDIYRVPKIYYSAGTSIEDLKNKVKHHGNIPCVTFDNLTDFVFNVIKSKYFK